MVSELNHQFDEYRIVRIGKRRCVFKFD